MKKPKLLIVDYGIGNQGSVANALLKLDCTFKLSGKREDILRADSYIFPGVGAFGAVMENILASDILSTLEHQVLEKKKPILGVCLGMQVFSEDSDELGFHKGLGWISGHVRKLPMRKGFRIPHVGWNEIKIIQKKPLFVRTEKHSNFYFDHSYALYCEQSTIAATCWHGSIVIAAVQKENIYGVQFHPEKSQSSGLKLYRSFSSMMS